MNLFRSALTVVVLWQSSFGAEHGELECTHGKLFVTDADSTTVHVFDSSASLEHSDGRRLLSGTPEHSFSAPGKAGLNIKATGNNDAVSVMYRGDAGIGYTDGTVSFFDSGLRKEFHGDHYDVSYVEPALISNAGFDCARVIHYTPHDDKIALFCDGTYDNETAGINQVNSTIWVVDETKFGTTDSAVVFNKTLQGSHHGVSIPVDDNHVLFSQATPDRINRTPGVG